MDNAIRYCEKCGRKLQDTFGILRCRQHELDWKKSNQVWKRGKYSGKSKTPYGGYQDR